MQHDAAFWSGLIALDKKADALIERVRRAVQPSEPISREIPFFGSLEVRFNNLLTTYAGAVSPNSDCLTGSNIKRADFKNGGSRVYIRELLLTPFRLATLTQGAFFYEGRVLGNARTNYPFNWRWNIYTSITQRQYATKSVLGYSAGRYTAGNRIAFRDPFVVEPMESLTLEVELLSFGMSAAGAASLPTYTTAVVSLDMSGYREGI